MFFASGLLLYQASICDTVLYENHVVYKTNKPSGVAVAILSDNSQFKLVIGQAAVNTRSQAEKRRWFHESTWYSVVIRECLTGFKSNAEKRDRFRSAMEWVGNMSKKIGLDVGVLKEVLFNDSAPNVMNSYANRCVCPRISVKLWAGGSVRKEVFPFSKRSRPDLVPNLPPLQ